MSWEPGGIIHLNFRRWAFGLSSNRRSFRRGAETSTRGACAPRI